MSLREGTLVAIGRKPATGLKQYETFALRQPNNGRNREKTRNGIETQPRKGQCIGIMMVVRALLFLQLQESDSR